ncbi:MAG: cupredoxin domain-containing protein [Myxococcota bacterium]
MSERETCTPDDLDGVIGGAWTFALVVDDTNFAPLILKTQNSSTVTVSLENRGTRPHDFAIDCLPTPNDDGCPSESCFPPEATIAPVEPGEKGSAAFQTPRVEGIYTFRSTLAGDTLTGQFVVQ